MMKVNYAGRFDAHYLMAKVNLLFVQTLKYPEKLYINKNIKYIVVLNLINTCNCCGVRRPQIQNCLNRLRERV